MFVVFAMIVSKVGSGVVSTTEAEKKKNDDEDPSSERSLYSFEKKKWKATQRKILISSVVFLRLREGNKTRTQDTQVFSFVCIRDVLGGRGTRGPRVTQDTSMHWENRVLHPCFDIFVANLMPVQSAHNNQDSEQIRKNGDTTWIRSNYSAGSHLSFSRIPEVALILIDQSWAAAHSELDQVSRACSTCNFCYSCRHCTHNNSCRHIAPYSAHRRRRCDVVCTEEYHHHSPLFGHCLN